MKLRNLCIKDAKYMLEWMHDEDVVKDLKTDFSKKDIKDCERFITESNRTNDNCHFAIVNDFDEYMGTVSLKNITESTAEFGIAIRKCAMGKGYSKSAMEETIQYGLEKLGLNCIYWCVDPINSRAVKFYDKNCYSRLCISNNVDLLKKIREIGGYTEEEINHYIWYSVSK
jgi:diamine N-acetyltransferase